MTGHAVGLGRAAAEGAGDGMFGAGFDHARLLQCQLAVVAGEGQNPLQGHAALGERAGLVEDDRINPVQAFQHVTAGDQQAELLQTAGRGGQCGRSRQ